MSAASKGQLQGGRDLGRDDDTEKALGTNDDSDEKLTADDDVECSVDQVSRLMREQDADLLESMHYAASQVSQYSPGGTPLLRPLDRSLPMEDLPLLSLSSTGQLLMDREHHSSKSLLRTATFQDTADRSQREVSDNEKNEADIEESNHHDEHNYRRLLSGEVRKNETETRERLPSAAEEETTASPITVVQETEIIIETEKDKGLAKQRRRSEAMQFAEAVGEKISINREELCIIEDQSDEEDSDDDDDETCSQVMVPPQESPSRVSSAIERREDMAALPEHVDVLKSPTRPRRKHRPAWPFGPAGSELDFLENLPGGDGENNFVYKGICANPPEITKRGIQRGNYAQLHRKAWLEVSDKYHRYGKNLRLYYRYWERLGFPTNQFFDWLDSKGEAAGNPLPNLEECPRSVLDSDTVLYISNPEVTDGYAIDIIPCEDGRGRVIDVDGDPVLTGPDGWIFVLRDNVVYAAAKITSISGHSKERFHHSSFFGGKAVASAGIFLTDAEGYLTRMYPHSGHYRPGEAHVQRMLFFFHRKGVDLRTFKVDTQQFSHVSREKDVKTKDKDVKEKEKDAQKKSKKVENLHLERAVYVACFLSHKAGFIGHGIFDKVHMIRKADVANVSEALEMVDDGGYWKGKAKLEAEVDHPNETI